MVIMLSYTCIAYTTVFTPRRLEEKTSAAEIARLENDIIIGILLHMLPMILGSNVRRF